MNLHLRSVGALALLAALAVADVAQAQSSSNEQKGLFNEVQDNRRFGFHTFSGFDSWRGVADGSYQNNNGLHSGFNLGGAIPRLEDYGLAWQFGASYGVYDWNGRQSIPTELAASQ